MPKTTRIGLLANRYLRTGPNSSLIRFVREFEPYFCDILRPKIFALEGTYRALIRYGLMVDYLDLHCLPSGHDGGVVDLTNLVVGKTSSDGTVEQIDQIIYLNDPRDATSLFPESIALKRECVVTGKPFLATYQAATEWYALEWFATIAQNEDSSNLSFEEKFFLEKDFLHDFLVTSTPKVRKPLGEQKIALISHDSKKVQMLQFALDNFMFLDRFIGRTATGTTGTLLNGEEPDEPKLTELKQSRDWGKLEPLVKEIGDVLRAREPVSPEIWV